MDDTYLGMHELNRMQLRWPFVYFAVAFFSKCLIYSISFGNFSIKSKFSEKNVYQPQAVVLNLWKTIVHKSVVFALSPSLGLSTSSL